jgi:hypothetical protein
VIQFSGIIPIPAKEDFKTVAHCIIVMDGRLLLRVKHGDNRPPNALEPNH